MDRKATMLQSNSPPFSQLIIWLKEENIQELPQFFQLNDMNTWNRKKYRSRFYAKIDLIKLKDEIYSELIDPLFIKPAINIKYEDNPREHRRDNLFCCFEVLLRDLKRIKKEELYHKFENTLRGFRLDYKKIVPSVDFPFSWMLDSQELSKEENNTRTKIRTRRQEWIRKKLKGLNEEMAENEKKRDEIMDDFIENTMRKILTEEWRRIHNETEKKKIKIDRLKKKGYILSQKLDMSILLSERILNWLKIARGKPGRHPEPFNVLVYHLINKCTYWKFDENHKPVFHEIGKRKGQHKLERDWKLILFLILDIHIHRKELPDLRKFISENKNIAAQEALKILKDTKLRNIPKNFPTLEGWSFPRKAYETGFRKLIVKDDGTLRIVML